MRIWKTFHAPMFISIQQTTKLTPEQVTIFGKMIKQIFNVYYFMKNLFDYLCGCNRLENEFVFWRELVMGIISNTFEKKKLVPTISIHFFQHFLPLLRGI